MTRHYVYADQQILAQIGGSIAACFILANNVVCKEEEKEEVITNLLSTILFLTGICTLLQIGLGLRSVVRKSKLKAHVKNKLSHLSIL